MMANKERMDATDDGMREVVVMIRILRRWAGSVVDEKAEDAADDDG